MKNIILNMKLFNILIFAILMNLNCFGSIDLTKINFNYKFDPDSEVQYHYKVAVADNLATIFVRLDFNSQKVQDPGIYNIRYEVKKAYDDPNISYENTLDETHLILAENNNRYYRFNVPVTKNETLVILKVNNTLDNSEYLFDVPVDLPLQFKKSSLMIMEKDRDIPIFSDYIGIEDSIRIVTLNENIDQVYFFYYSKNFPPADPPMATRTSSVEKELEVDSSAMVFINQVFSLPSKGLYFFQSDTTTAQGISILANDDYFPQFVKAETLVEPIIYISTAREIKKIRDNEDKKKAMDTYWLELTKSPERAKKIIRDYYRQIELANYLFTTYKEGWKTDRGMILTLFGKPDAVFTNGDVEEWIYERRGSMSRINFNFIKIKNVFSDDHYELVRNPGLDRDWFRIVDQWRKGRQEI